MKAATSGRFILLLLLLYAHRAPGLEPVPTFYPPAEHIVAIGDVHGDLQAVREVFKMARITNGLNQWVAKDLVVVQTGDLLDRGDQEQEVLEFLWRLQEEAAAAGGALHLLNGNHELMNARLDLRYVTEGGFADFEDAVEFDPADSLLANFPPEQRARVAAFRPGGPMARRLSRNNVVVVIGDNVFVHGGLLPEHLDMGLEELNLAVRRWLAGEGPEPEWVHKSTSPTWVRDYSDDPGPAECARVDEVLSRLEARRMIVGHTVQDGGITARCRGRVWCIDVGLAAYYDGPFAALKIDGDVVEGISIPTQQFR